MRSAKGGAMRKAIYLLVLLVCYVLMVPARPFAQIVEEKEARVAQMQMLQKPAVPGYHLTSQASLFGGYDSNVSLSPEGKGSVFQEFLYALKYDTPLAGGCRLFVNYDLDFLNYSETAHFSNLMNHLRLDLNKKLSKLFSSGIGYDFSYFYYPNNADDDYMFHKGFVYLRNNLSDKTYHQLTLEYGYKRHTSRKALANSLTALQDKELTETRQSVAYTIGTKVSSKLNVSFKIKFSENDSNARYLDYYDYKSYEGGPSVQYTLSKRIDMIASFIYLRRNYNSRTLSISGSTEKEKDNVYYVNAGCRYKVNGDNSATIFYTYRDNDTNEPLEKYNENVVTVGWEHRF
jgi:hypothetical protein